MRTQGGFQAAQAPKPDFIPSLFIEGPFQGLGFINPILFPNGDFLQWHEFAKTFNYEKENTCIKPCSISLGNDMLVYFLPLSSLISHPKSVTVKSLGRDPSRHLVHAEMDQEFCHLLDCG